VKLPHFNKAGACEREEFSTFSADTTVGADMDGGSKLHAGDAGTRGVRSDARICFSTAQKR